MRLKVSAVLTLATKNHLRPDHRHGVDLPPGRQNQVADAAFPPLYAAAFAIFNLDHIEFIQSSPRTFTGTSAVLTRSCPGVKKDMSSPILRSFKIRAAVAGFGQTP